jgi:hypothetical protein
VHMLFYIFALPLIVIFATLAVLGVAGLVCGACTARSIRRATRIADQQTAH